MSQIVSSVKYFTWIWSWNIFCWKIEVFLNVLLSTFFLTAVCLPFDQALEDSAANAAEEERRRLQTQTELQDRYKMDLEREKMVCHSSSSSLHQNKRWSNCNLNITSSFWYTVGRLWVEDNILAEYLSTGVRSNEMWRRFSGIQLWWRSFKAEPKVDYRWVILSCGDVLITLLLIQYVVKTHTHHCRVCLMKVTTEDASILCFSASGD